jgi:hypothetical protein
MLGMWPFSHLAKKYILSCQIESSTGLLLHLWKIKIKTEESKGRMKAKKEIDEWEILLHRLSQLTEATD